MNWLRAKARYNHWEEEHNIVVHEMKWTILWFEHHMEAWKKRAEESEMKRELGHASYAWKQAELWKSFKEKPSASFAEKV